MENSIKYFSLILSLLVLVFYSCSKEEEEVGRYEYIPTNLDIGHLTIKINEITFGNDPSTHVTSIQFSNLTTGVTNPISYNNSFIHIQDEYSYLSVPLANGHVNDQVQCCVEFDNVTNTGIAVAYEDIHPDSMTMTFINMNFRMDL